MNKTWLVLRNGIISQVTRKSWLLVTCGLPVLLALIMLVPPLLRGNPSGASASSEPVTSPTVEGYVDQSGLITRIPDNVAGLLRPYSDEASARRAMASGEISAYYLVPADYVESGDLAYVLPDPKAFSLDGQSWVMRWVLLVNMVGGDEGLAQRLQNPVNLRVRALTPSTGPEVGEGPAYWIPYTTAMILYIIIIMSSSLLRSSLGDEKKNRVLEILMVSLSPQQILTGKVVALAVVGLLQTAIWAGTGYLLLKVAGGTINLPPASQLPVAVVLWALVFFILGYGVYASLLAGLGALTGPNVPGSSTADFVIIWPMIIPVFLMTIIIPNVNGLLAVLLSLFPPTAPVAMITRLAVGGVPWWQPVLSAVLLGVTVALVFRVVARAFRAQVLMSGQAFTSRGYFALLMGREEPDTRSDCSNVGLE